MYPYPEKLSILNYLLETEAHSTNSCKKINKTNHNLDKIKGRWALPTLQFSASPVLPGICYTRSRSRYEFD